MVESDLVNLYGPKFQYVVLRFLDVIRSSMRNVFGEDLRTSAFMKMVATEIQRLWDEDFPRDLNDPQVLMEYREEERRRREERRNNQTMYPPAYPPSRAPGSDAGGKTESEK